MIILCADDFGISESVSRGIDELCQAGRLSATSAMVTFEDWQRQAARLRAIRETAAVGLHLNLTLGQPMVASIGAGHLDEDGHFLSAGTLIKRATLHDVSGARPAHRIYVGAVHAECRAQIAAFRDAVGALPDFIDGHQHVHVLSKVRSALLDAVSEFPWAYPPLVRVPSNDGPWYRVPLNEWRKRGVIAGFSIGMRKRLMAAGLPANDTFSGFSSFTLGSDYGRELRAALKGGGACHLVMCHPGHVDAQLVQRGDPLVERRAEELAGIHAFDGLPQRIWHPTREPSGAINWIKAMAA